MPVRRPAPTRPCRSTGLLLHPRILNYPHEREPIGSRRLYPSITDNDASIVHRKKGYGRAVPANRTRPRGTMLARLGGEAVSDADHSAGQVVQCSVRRIVELADVVVACREADPVRVSIDELQRIGVSG